MGKKKQKNLIILNSSKENVQFNLNAESGTVTFRKQILKTGEYKFPNSKTKSVVFDDKYFDAVIEAFDAGVIENVSIILGTHDEGKTEKLVGRVNGLEKEKNGLYAIMEIADEDLVAQIDTKLSDGKGIVDEVSVSLGPAIDDEGNEYPLALFHVAVVTHAWYQGMDSFERLAAMIKRDDADAKFVILNSASSLEEQSSQVRVAFFDTMFENYDYTVEGVYEEYIVIYSYKDSIYYKLDYSVVDGGISFGEKVKVEKEFIEAKMEDNVDINEVLQALKENGIEVDGIDDLKSKLGNADKQKTAMAQINAALNPGNKDDEPDHTKLIASVDVLTASAKKQDEKITELQESLSTNEATQAVDKLVEAGKVTPAKKEHYMALHKQNKALFASITDDMPKEVPLGQAGANSGKEDIDGDLNPEAEAKRILAATGKSGSKEA